MAERSGATLVRFARAADRAAVVDLIEAMGGHDDVRRDDASPHAFGFVLASPDYRALVAERDGIVVGVAVLHARTTLLYDRREAWLGVLAVAPEARSHGIGAALLAAADREAAALGCASLVLETSLVRERTHAFYRERGFVEGAPARRFERPVGCDDASLVARFLEAAARAATRVVTAVAGCGVLAAVAIGADGAPTEAADDAAERAALAELLPLGIPIVSEEAGLVGASRVDAAQPWISLDPLDGSRNFVAGYPAYATSMGLVRGGRALAGLVAELPSGRRWAARAGAGATCDGRAMRARAGPLAGMPSPLPGTGGARDVPGYSRVRISGSTASDLCRVADGSLAAFVALERPVVHVHDLAAAMVAIEEAGGCVIARDGSRPELVPDPALVLEIVAACDAPTARRLAGLA